ncbi:TIGR03089 family protein [Actinobacteria bacterium YIM 96077]|uniref:TIGR03089 family protein n=1 Tax=Phytoactinopolyspora halophila TaxID=1981511 RepID=A0A329R4N0_9ACTN|nr:TIGR03089 family protein [Phytoactinopolyspora halophila]AYY15223.1 TIGR03089 family protein [Actinobacteria bacterium YIM 96077]RAW18979.1 TIGR03089 family protein [Phytoactinopolyspora halophila]
MVTTPYELLRHELQRDGSRPFVTYYDDATGERVELSVATFDNWVAKTAGLLRDDLAADAGARVALLLPPHWQALVWAGACWAVGACLTDSIDDAAAVVTGPDSLEDAAASDVDDVIAHSLRPMGARFADPLPIGVLDYAVEVPGHADELVAYVPPSADEPALEAGGAVHTLGGLVEHARERAKQLGIGPEARLLVPASDVRAAVVDAFLVPLVVSGSAVLVQNEETAGRDNRTAAERVTTVVPTPAPTADDHEH